MSNVVAMKHDRSVVEMDNAADEAPVKSVGDIAAKVADRLAAKRGQVTDENPTLDPLAKHANELVEKIAKGEGQVGQWRIELGHELRRLRGIINARSPDTFKQDDGRVYKGDDAKARHWRKWVRDNINGDYSELYRAEMIAADPDPEAALARSLADGRARVERHYDKKMLDVKTNDTPLRARIREKYVDGKFRKPEAIAKALDAPVEKVKHVLNEMAGRPATFKEDVMRRPDGAFALTPIDRQVPLSRIKALIGEPLAEIIAEAKKGQVRIVPMLILKHAKKIEDAISEWEK